VGLPQSWKTLAICLVSIRFNSDCTADSAKGYRRRTKECESARYVFCTYARKVKDWQWRVSEGAGQDRGLAILKLDQFGKRWQKRAATPAQSPLLIGTVHEGACSIPRDGRSLTPAKSLNLRASLDSPGSGGTRTGLPNVGHWRDQPLIRLEFLIRRHQ
jgi:hypothetical protein